MVQSFSIVTLLTDFYLPNLLLQLLQRFSELAQISDLLSSLLQIICLRLSDGSGSFSEQHFIFRMASG